MNYLKVELTQSGKVTLKIEKRDAYGRVRGRQQISFTRYEFEHALREAQVVVPWNKVQA